ncbi:hypothetical protein [Tunturiibacter lichenicola]|uniref:hypothetical protein n=1 Tax=Tunturiibacter lichenicola TaxID=2051959 RepID=UPI003D9BDA05
MQKKFTRGGRVLCLACLLVCSKAFVEAQSSTKSTSPPAKSPPAKAPAATGTNGTVGGTKPGTAPAVPKPTFPWSHPKPAAVPNAAAHPAAEPKHPAAEPARAASPAMDAHAGGINQRPLPTGHVIVRPDGNRILSSAGGRNYLVRSNGSVAVYARGETRATFAENGGFRSLHTANMDIHHGLRGDVQIASVRPDGARVVSYGAHSGYLERPMGAGRVQRTYLEGGVSHSRVYRTYTYRGVVMHEYVAPVRYAPAFYGWAATPWPAPVTYAWGWSGQPWYVSGGAMFTPYPVYSGASLWLTDYLLAANLQAAYAQQGAAAAAVPLANGADAALASSAP